jgi:hypothetical protein
MDPEERSGIGRTPPEGISSPRPTTWLYTGHPRHEPELRGMRPTRFELATFGLKDRRSLGPRKDPLTTELRALGWER